MSIAEAHAGVNSNLLADEELFDALSGNAVLNGIPVEVEPAPSLRIVDGIGAEDPQRTMTV
jgi:hypothetical protein